MGARARFQSGGISDFMRLRRWHRIGREDDANNMGMMLAACLVPCDVWDSIVHFVLVCLVREGSHP